ncbi:general substrate transporter [Plenodomus tracheiphilus IPT5]|uniref:General substrate transporter n=1 Tax=Plenodomus tracheiphilus IPT5 TaxID=1408161 RepID=A0A6A7B3B9_9PLEO|nr:general substrate transporter [Plenodomus tracheiphilus IPT5]
MPELRGRALMLTVSVLTSLGFMLIGYDNGLMGGLVGAPAFNKTFDKPSANMIGTIVAIFEIGAFLGAITTALIGESLGRRKSIFIGACISLLGALLQSTAYTRAHLITSRIISGIGLGFINSTVPVMQAEFSPKASRGIYVCAQLSTLNFGILLVYWIDYAFVSHTGSYAWRVPMILQAVILLAIMGLVMVVPETPRWLAAHDRPEECLAVLARIADTSPDDGEVRRLHAIITQTVAFEKSRQAGWKDIVRSDPIKSRRRFLIACGIQMFQQLGGINAIIYYSGTLFEKSIGFDTHMASLMSGFLQTWFFVASFIPWFLIDRIGRRPLLLSMISLMAVVMAVQAGLIYQVQHATASAHTAGIAAAAMLFIFQGAFTIGFQATVWVYPSEILPLRLRQRGSSISTAANWICNYIIVQITPPAINNIGWRTYIIFAVLNATWVPIIYLFFPETKGLELEDVDRLFSGESTVSEMMSEKKGVDEERVEAVVKI